MSRGPLSWYSGCATCANAAWMEADASDLADVVIPRPLDATAPDTLVQLAVVGGANFDDLLRKWRDLLAIESTSSSATSTIAERVEAVGSRRGMR